MVPKVKGLYSIMAMRRNINAAALWKIAIVSEGNKMKDGDVIFVSGCFLDGWIQREELTLISDYFISVPPNLMNS